MIHPFLFALAANSLVLLLMTFLAPLDYVTIDEGLDSFGRPNEFSSRCNFEDDQLPYLITLGVLNGGCLLFALFQAYESRNLSVEFSESLYVFQALMLIMLSSLIGIPLLLLARDDANSYTFLACSIIFVICSSILSVIFVPKIQYLQKKQKDESSNSENTRSLERLSSPSELFQRGMSFSGRNGSTIRVSGLVEPNSTGSGLKVYGAQTKEELFEEVRKLTKEVTYYREQDVQWLKEQAEKDGSQSISMRLECIAEKDLQQT